MESNKLPESSEEDPGGEPGKTLGNRLRKFWESAGENPGGEPGENPRGGASSAGLNARAFFFIFFKEIIRETGAGLCQSRREPCLT